MLKKKTMGILACLTVICTATAGVLIYRNPNKKSTLEEDIVKVENALGDQYKKQSVTTLAATLTYGDEDADTKIYYHILKTDYYEQDASEITGLNTVAFGVVAAQNFCQKFSYFLTKTFGNYFPKARGCRTKQLVRSSFSVKKIQPDFEKSGCWCKI